MNSLDTIRAEIAELRDAIAGINARREQIAPEIQEHRDAVDALSEERLRCLVDSEAAAIQIRALERAEAVLIEHTAPEPAPVDQRPEEQLPLAPEPIPVSATRQRVRDDLRDSARARIECDPRDPAGTAPTPKPDVARRPGRRAGNGGSVTPNPLRVAEREGVIGVSRPKPNGKSFIGEGAYAEKLKRRTATDAARAELVHGFLRSGPTSQQDLGELMAMELDCKPVTAATITSFSLAILYEEGRIVDTGEKALGRDGRRQSPIWQVKS